MSAVCCYACAHYIIISQLQVGSYQQILSYELDIKSLQLKQVTFFSPHFTLCGTEHKDDIWTCECVNVTYNNQQDEVDEVVEGMSIHHVVHDLHPALQSDHLSRKQMTGNK